MNIIFNNNRYILFSNEDEFRTLKKQHAEDKDEEYDIDDANGDPDNNDYDNDASMMLDYELGETSMNYLLDDEDGIDARLGPSKLMSGNKYNNYIWVRLESYNSHEFLTNM